MKTFNFSDKPKKWQKKCQILQNGQMCFFMASAVKNWPNFSKLAMKRNGQYGNPGWSSSCV